MDSVIDYLSSMGVQGWFWLGVVLLAIGIYVVRNEEKDAFNRRNEYGVEVFDSWDHRQRVRLKEGFRTLISAIFILPGTIITFFAGLCWIFMWLHDHPPTH